MWTFGELALAILITPALCWLLYQLVESFGGCAPTERLVAPASRPRGAVRERTGE